MLHVVEPITHMLTGACLSRAAGFPAKARYATAACVIAAELPDADYVYRLGGPLLYFQHHRGWTHALWSLPLQAALVVLFCWVMHRTRRLWKKRRSIDDPAPVQWPLLFLMALLALCSHILLDWTNNYGVRPFAPWNAHWYAAELIYIVEPLLLLVLALALLLPFLFSLVNREIGMHRARYSGRGFAVAALSFMVLLWIYRYAQRADALTLLQVQEFRGGRVLHASLDPYPINPYHWHAIVETPANYQTGSVDTRIGIFDSDPQQISPKPATTLSTLAAKRSWLGQIYLDWSKFPTVTEAGTAAEVHPEMELSPAQGRLHVVQFGDLRFRYDVLGLNSTSRPPLGAEAWVDDDRHVVRIFVGSAEQSLP